MNRNWEDISNDCIHLRKSAERGVVYCGELSDHWELESICSMYHCVRQVIIHLGAQERWKCPICKRINEAPICPFNH